MNYSIYQSFARIPLGVAVTIEFLGPLAVAVASSRGSWTCSGSCWRPRACCCSPAAAPAWPAARGAGGVLGLSVQATGIGFALVAAACWAAYILLSRATGRRFSGSSGLVIAMMVAAVVVTGPSVAQASAIAAEPGGPR